DLLVVRAEQRRHARQRALVGCDRAGEVTREVAQRAQGVERLGGQLVRRTELALEAGERSPGEADGVVVTTLVHRQLRSAQARLSNLHRALAEAARKGLLGALEVGAGGLELALVDGQQAEIELELRSEEHTSEL